MPNVHERFLSRQLLTPRLRMTCERGAALKRSREKVHAQTCETILCFSAILLLGVRPIFVEARPTSQAGLSSPTHDTLQALR